MHSSVTKANAIAAKIAELDSQIDEALSGRTATIVSSYNGQPCGRSKRSWKGRIVHIDKAFYSGFGTKPRITIWLKEERAGGGAAAVVLEELEVQEAKEIA